MSSGYGICDKLSYAAGLELLYTVYIVAGGGVDVLTTVVALA